MSLMLREYKTITRISGPLVFVEVATGVGFGELVRVVTPDGTERRGQVLEVSDKMAVVQVFEGTSGLDVKETSVSFAGETIKLPVSSDMLGRVFDGSGTPIDKGPNIIPPPDQPRQFSAPPPNQPGAPGTGERPHPPAPWPDNLQKPPAPGN